MSKVLIKCAMPEWSGLGRVFGDLMYGDHSLRDLINWAGCPNDGGEHTFTIDDEKDDVVSFLDLLIVETNKRNLSFKYGVNSLKVLSEFVDLIKSTDSNKRVFVLKQFVQTNYPEMLNYDKR